jgi:hypothetical protein
MSKSKKNKAIVGKLDARRAAAEIKRLLDEKAFDLIDYGMARIQCFPPPNDPKKFPEIFKLSAKWLKFYDDSEKAVVNLPDEVLEKMTYAQAMEKLDPGLAKTLEECDAATAQIADLVNKDETFWESLRAKVIPLYEKHPKFDEWKDRWKKITLGFDPDGFEVVTTQMYTNQKTGERIRGEVVKRTPYPAGFVVEVV